MGRMTQTALAGMLLTMSVAGAKPPGPMTDPRVSGHEGSPIEREFHEVATLRVTSNYRPLNFERSERPLPIASWADWLRGQIPFDLTIPLGTIEVKD